MESGNWALSPEGTVLLWTPIIFLERRALLWIPTPVHTLSAPAADTSHPAEAVPDPGQAARAGFKVDYILMHKDAVQNLIENLLCQFCEVALLEAQCVETHGFCIKFSVVRKGCRKVCNDNYTSPRVLTRPPSEVNHKTAQSCLSIGVGHTGLQKLSTC